MAKKKLKPFRAAKAVKAAAREIIGRPPATRAVPQKVRKSDQKHRPTLGKLLEEQQ